MFSFRMNAVNCNHLRNRTLTTSLYSSRDSWAWYSSCPYVTVVLNSAAPCFYLFIYLFIYLFSISISTIFYYYYDIIITTITIIIITVIIVFMISVASSKNSLYGM